MIMVGVVMVAVAFMVGMDTAEDTDTAEGVAEAVFLEEAEEVTDIAKNLQASSLTRKFIGRSLYNLEAGNNLARVAISVLGFTVNKNICIILVVLLLL